MWLCWESWLFGGVGHGGIETSSLTKIGRESIQSRLNRILIFFCLTKQKQSKQLRNTLFIFLPIQNHLYSFGLFYLKIERVSAFFSKLLEDTFSPLTKYFRYSTPMYYNKTILISSSTWSCRYAQLPGEGLQMRMEIFLRYSAGNSIDD